MYVIITTKGRKLIMANNKKRKEVIVISKDKLLKGVGITIGIVLFLIICFVISSSHTETYKESTIQEEDSGDDVLQTAILQAGEVSDDERKQPNEITIDEYLNMYNGKGQQLVLLSRPTCQYCKIATPIIENIIYKYNVTIHYINTDELDSDENSKLVTSDEYFSQGYGTPTLLVVGNGQILDQIDGLTTKDEYISFFQKYGFME